LLPVEDTQLFYQIAVKGRNELPLAPDPRTGLEMTLLRMLAFRPAATDSAAPGTAASGSAPGAKSTTGSPRQARGKATRAASPPAAATPAKAPLPTAKDATQTTTKPPEGVAKEAAPKPAPPTAEAEARSPEPPAKPAGNDWVALLEQLDLSGQVRELARNVQLQRRSDDRWDFIIAPALRHLGSAACVSRLSEAISDRMGHPVSVRIIENKDSEPLTAAALEQQQLHRNRSEAERAIREDPTVRALQEQMGAQLVDDSIQPLQ
jgi:DNA polymerase-3 subunit gamma/tau